MNVIIRTENSGEESEDFVNTSSQDSGSVTLDSVTLDLRRSAVQLMS
jgi:hypothetical protein